MFELSTNEKGELVTNCDRFSGQGKVFEQGSLSRVTGHASHVEAIRINIEIMRAFARYRAYLNETTELRNDLKELDRKFTSAFNLLVKDWMNFIRRKSYREQGLGLERMKYNYVTRDT